MNSKSTLTFTVCLVAFLIATAPTNADTMYGGIGNGSPNPGALATINQTTGAGVVVGDPVTPGGLTGLAFASAGTLYGSTITGGGSTSNLILINPDTGALVSTIGGIGISIGDLAINPLTGVLYGIRSNADGTSQGGLLYTINVTTGAASLVGDTGAGAGGGLAFTPDGKLFQTSYFGGSFALNQLNLTDGSVLSHVALSDYYDGLGIRSDGTFFATGSGFFGDGIFTIDPTTGLATLLGPTGVGITSDLDFRPNAVPEDTNFFMFPLVLFLLFAARRFVRDPALD